MWNMPHFKAFGLMNLQYEIRICHKIHNKGTMSQWQIQVTIFLSGTDVSTGPMTSLKEYLCFIMKQTSGIPDRWNNNFLLIWLLTFLKTQCVFANPTYVNRLEKHCTAVWQSNTATYDNRKKGQLVTKLFGWSHLSIQTKNRIEGNATATTGFSIFVLSCTL